MLRNVGTLMVAAVVFLALPASFAAGEEWEAYTGISGVGAVVKDTPAATDSVHYSGHGTAENATFHVSLVDPEDKDRCRLDAQSEWVVKTYTITLADVTWGCGGQGTITTAGFYTPPNTPMNGITITAYVNDDSTGCTDDPTVPKSYLNTLNAFKVGVKVWPASETIWEDDGGDNPHTWTAFDDDDIAGLTAYKITTYLDAWSSGFYEDSDDWHLSETKWKAVTTPEHCSMVGETQFTPRIDVAGTLYLKPWGDCIGSGAQILASAIAAAGAAGGDPYVAAGAAVVASVMSGQCSPCLGVAGDAAIQYVADSDVTEEIENWWGIDFDWDIEATQPLSSLSINGAVSLANDEDRLGSCKIATKVSVYDDSWIAKAGGWIDYDGEDTYYIKYGTSIPSYNATPN